MNVDELRQAFTLSDRIEQSIRGFRRERLRDIDANNTVVPIRSVGRIVLHLIPLSAAVSRESIPLEQLKQQRDLLLPIGDGGSPRINLDGFLFHSGDDGNGFTSAYTQLYRNGTIEAVRTVPPRSQEKNIPSMWYEKELIDAVGRYLSAQRGLNVQPPVYLFLGLTGVRDYRFGVSREHFGGEDRLDRNDIEIGEVGLKDLAEPPAKILRPVFDQVWQAFGFDRSYNFDENGNWVGQR